LRQVLHLSRATTPARFVRLGFRSLRLDRFGGRF
jgi:hypothetical protein